jgi:hypothetical protein
VISDGGGSVDFGGMMSNTNPLHIKGCCTGLLCDDDALVAIN